MGIIATSNIVRNPNYSNNADFIFLKVDTALKKDEIKRQILTKGMQPEGVNYVMFNASHLACGLYRLRAGDTQLVRSMLLVKKSLRQKRPTEELRLL